MDAHLVADEQHGDGCQDGGGADDPEKEDVAGRGEGAILGGEHAQGAGLHLDADIDETPGILWFRTK